MVIVKTAPKLRFKDFTDNWKKQKLGKIAKRVSVGIATSSSKYFSSKPNAVPFIKNQDIKDGTIDLLHLEHITPDFDRANRNKRVHPGDILTIRTGYPGKSAVVPNKLDNAQTFTTLITTLKEENPSFVCNYINSNFGKKQIIAVQAGGAQVNVNANRLKEIIIGLPSLKEQNQIDNLLTAINHIISLQQRKLDQLQELKKGFLQNLFPKDGALVPNIRFKGFTDDWKQRKLGEVAITFSGDTPAVSDKKYYNGSIPFIKSGELGNKKTEQKITKLGLENSSAKMIKKGTLLYALYGATSGECAISSIDGAINQAILAILPQEDKIIFLLQWLNKNKEKILKKYLQGGQGNLSAAIIKKLEIPHTNNKEESQVSKIFKLIDSLLVLQQQKIEKLQQFKKFLLQNMFI